MSNVTTFYDTLLAASATLFPSKTKIPNAYDISRNSEMFLRDGYGVKMNGTTPDSENAEFKDYQYGVEFSLVFSREILRLKEDTVLIETATKAIYEDVHTARLDFYNVDQLGIDDNILRVDLGPSSGIEFIEGDNYNFIAVEVNFTAYIRETL